MSDEVKTHFVGDDCPPDGHRTELDDWRADDRRYPRDWTRDDLSSALGSNLREGYAESYRVDGMRVFMPTDDVDGILAELPGHNDELSWHWVIRMKSDRFVYLEASCDYTGWDCRSGIDYVDEDVSLDALLERIPENRRRERTQLTAQVRGEQPFALEVRGAPG